MKGAAPPARPCPVLVWGLGVAAAAAPFLFCFFFVVRLFYVQGAWFNDAGWMASLIWRNDISLSNPPFIRAESFYDYHISPLFHLVNLASWLLPLDMVHFFALFQAFLYGGLAAVMFFFVISSLSVRGWREVLAASVLSLAFAANGISQAILRTQHFEIAIPLALCVFLALMVRRRFRMAAVAWIAGLALREDVGFHIAAILGPAVLLGWRHLREQGALSHWIRFGAAAFAYSALVMAVQYLFFQPVPLVEMEYAGSPPFSHVTLDLVAERLRLIATERTYVYLPLLVIVAWAVRSRQPLLAAGVAGNLPWLALHLFAADETLGRWGGYSPFPIIAALFWPLGAIVLAAGGTLPARGRNAVFVWQATVLAFSLFGPTELPFKTALGSYPERTARAVKTFMAVLAEHPEPLGRHRAAVGVVALSPRGFPENRFLYDGTKIDGAIDSIVYFTTGLSQRLVSIHAAAAGLRRAYGVRDTNIGILTKRDLHLSPVYGSLLEPCRGLPAGPGG